MKKTNTKKLTTLGVLAACSIVLVSFIHFPIFPAVSFLEYDPADIPILIGTFLFGPIWGVVLTVIVSAIQGMTVSAQSGVYGIVMHVVATSAFTLVAGLIYKPFVGTTKKTLGVILSAVSCPLVNTGIFVAALFVFYYDLMVQYAAENAFAGAVAFIFIGIVGLNFVVEFVINVLLIPLVLRLMAILKVTRV